MLLVALLLLTNQKSKAIESTKKALQRCLDYLLTIPNGTKTCTASNMILLVHSDCAYLLKLNAKSRVGGYFLLSNLMSDVSKLSQIVPCLNSLMHALHRIFKNVVSSAAKCEIARVFKNRQDAIIIQHALIEIGYPQSPTPIQVNNTIAQRFINSTIKEKRNKSINVKYHWLKDRKQPQ